jgi:membrane protease YdiL (CAAX protease family)
MSPSRAGALWVLFAYSFFIVGAGVVSALNERFWGAALVPVLGGSVQAGLISAVLGVCLFSINVAATRLGPVRALELELAELVRPLLGLGPWPLALASGVAEEWVFRGLLMPFVGLWLQGLIFGILHWPGNRRLWPWTLWTVGMGWLLGALTLHTGALWPAMLTHTLINGLALTRLSRLDSRVPA